MNSENAAEQPSSAINRRKQTLEHLSARHQQLKQQKQFRSDPQRDEITRVEDEVESVKTETEPAGELPDTSCFLVDFKGAVLGANFQGIDHIYCRYSYVYGPDWKIINGENESGYSQMASRNSLTKSIYLNTFDSCNSRSGNQLNSGDSLDFVWNLPIELTMSSSNVHGWPQLAVSVYGLNFFGLDVVRGYVNWLRLIAVHCTVCNRF